MPEKEREENFITVYWAPSKFISTGEQWNMLYGEPKPVIDNLVSDIPEDSLMVQCPATRGALKNVYSLHSNLDESFNFDDIDLAAMSRDREMGSYSLPVDSKITLFRERPTSFEGYVNVLYNLGWVFFSDQPVVARWTAPYFPAVNPVPGSIFAVGEFDIGQWFRSVNIDYHIPVDAKAFTLNVGDPLAFLEIKTDKQVRLQRFLYTPEVHNLVQEFTNAPMTYGRKKTLAQRYEMSRRSGMRDLVLHQIRSSLI